MTRKNILKGSAISCLTFLLAACGTPGEERKAAEPATKLTFAYLTDVHLNKDNTGNGNEGLRKALKAAADNGAEFLLFGGDNADTDALGDAETTADTLHARFTRLVEETGLPAYYTIGNHDRYYRFEGQPDTLGFRMFEKHYGPSHRSFTRKGVHFVILNSLYPEGNGGYNVGNKQLEWLKADLDSIGKQTPVIVSTHVPMLSLYYPVVEGSMKALDMINDTKAVVDVLKDHNTQLVLQGHQHIYEQIQERDQRISDLTVTNQIMQPKADYFDQLVDRNLLTSFRDTAKLIGVKEKAFIQFLLDKKYIYRNKRGQLMPYADRDCGCFEVKESTNEKTGWSGTQTLITPKGRETFRLLCEGM